MNKSTQLTNKAAVSLIKVTRNGQVTLPAGVRKALQVKEGDYIAAEAFGSGVLLKPISVINREETEQHLDEILSRVSYTGLEPMPPADDLAAEVADIIHDMRRENAEGGAR
jgi:AbrB family looped-hinge helix DNA binding protein